MLLDQILVVLGLSVLIMISPGPDMVVVMRNTLLGGRAGGLLTSLGVLTGNVVHVTYCAVGIGLLISQSIIAFAVLKYAAAAYLFYLGVTSLLAKGHAEAPVDARAETGKPPPGGNWYLQGFINNVLNPKGPLFYLGLFTVVITPETSTPATVLLVSLSILVSALFWLFFVFTLDSGAVRNLLQRSQRLVSRVFGGLLIFLGIRVAVMER